MADAPHPISAEARAEHPLPAAVDVAIIGAGPAGSAAARRLAQAGCRVLLVERSRFDQPRVGESLAPSVQPLLRDLGVWSAFNALRPWPSWGTRSLWGSDTPEVHSHMLSVYGCGWHIDRLAFDRMLANEATQAGAHLVTGTTLASSRRSDNGGWLLQLAAAEDASPPQPAGPATAPTRTVAARFLLDATGRSAHVSRALGAQRLMFDNLVGIATQWAVDTDRPRPSIKAQGFILVETVAEGWWYSAPLPDPSPSGAMVGMLFTDADLCGRQDLTHPMHWRQRLAQSQATQQRLLGEQRQLRWGPRTFSAVSQRLCRAEFHDPWLALGDAALSVDPISGSGVVRALRTAKAAAEAVLACLQVGGGTRMSEILQGFEGGRDRECTDYLTERAAYYAQEDRWAAAPFWRRRAQAQARQAVVA